MLTKKKERKIILTMEGAKKYILLFAAFEALPEDDVFIVGTRKLENGYGVVYKINCSWKQYQFVKKILGDYIVDEEA